MSMRRQMSCQPQATHHYLETLRTKLSLQERSRSAQEPTSIDTPWADLIKAAKTSLACWNVDTQVIWERFLAFNRSRGNAHVPAGYLLGFMRRWRTSSSSRAPTVCI